MKALAYVFGLNVITLVLALITDQMFHEIAGVLALNIALYSLFVASIAYSDTENLYKRLVFIKKESEDE